MTKKLIHKTSKAYLLFTTILLVITAPTFYLIIQNLFLEDVDEALELHKDEFLKYTVSKLKQTDISFWNKYNSEIKILETQNTKKETYFYKTYYNSLSQESETYRVLNVPIFIEGKPYTLSVRANIVESEDLIVSISIIFIAILFFLLLGLFLINKRLSYKLWTPFYQTLEKIEAFEIDKTNQPLLPKTNIEEFNRLNQSIEKLIEKNASIYANQREFVENAAHELQTPLAVFQAKIDLLIQNSDFTQKQFEILSSLNDSISRLNRLNKNLLLLSKIENDNFNKKEVVILNELLEKNLGFFTEQATAKNLDIKMELIDKVIVKSNPLLVEILIGNLFLNAIKHNINDGIVFVTLTNQSLTFSNSGQSTPLVSDELFKRFSKSNPSEQGNGLGLAIIMNIVKINGWSIQYNFSNQLHQFKIIFQNGNH
jgi:signal transduction histidine kinase